MTFEDVIRIRTRAGLSRKQLAERLFVTPDTIRAWESPPEDPHHRRVQKWHARELKRIEQSLFRGDDIHAVDPEDAE